MLKIALIGCGKIGSRHLQSLVKLKYKSHIYLIDPNKESINISLNQINDDLKKNKKITTQVLSKLDELPNRLDFVIIATDSKPRFKILKGLLEKKKVKFLILEKLLFSKEKEFHEALKLIENSDSKVWVNQWMSLEPGFRDLCNYFDFSEEKELSVIGDNWGLCCNSVHYLELFDFLCERSDLKITEYDFEKVFFSKRQSYLEINGVIVINSLNGSNLTLISNDADILDGEETIILIKTSKITAECVFRVDSLNCKFIRKGKVFNKKYNLILQSDLTHRIIEEIITKGSCNLPSFERAVYHHNLFYPFFRDFFKEKGVNVSKGLPIT